MGGVRVNYSGPQMQLKALSRKLEKHIFPGGMKNLFEACGLI